MDFVSISSIFLIWNYTTATAFSRNLTTIHTCCSTQFAYFENGNTCYNWEDEKDVVQFPQNLFRNFRLIPQGPNCNDTTRIFVSIDKLKLTLADTGQLKYAKKVYNVDEYCIDSLGIKTAALIIPDKSRCGQNPVPKCCAKGQDFDIGRRQCLASKSRSSSSFARMTFDLDPGFDVLNSKDCFQVHNFTNIECWNPAVRYKMEGNLLEYESTTGVFVRGKWKSLEQPFCVERMTNFDSICSKLNPDEEAPEIVFYCAQHEEISSYYYAVAMGILWIVTSVLLLVTGVINVTRLQKNSHGWVLFCYLITSALLNFIAGIFMLAVDQKRDGCNFLDFATKFLYSSTLCWMTMVNFDLWWTFRKLENVKTQEIRERLPYYFIFAWSVPTATTMICWFIGKAGVRNEAIETHCILYDHALILYSSGPIVFLILINLCLFIRTALTIQKIRSATRLILKESRVQRESFRLFSKLFLMSGPIWTLRVILLALQFQGNYLTWYGVLIETIFSLPDIAFFLLVILHPKVTLFQRIPCLRRVSHWFHESHSLAPRNSISLQDQASLRRREMKNTGNGKRLERRESNAV